MRKLARISTPLFVAILFLGGCATVKEGNDPVVVRAESATQLAVDTFNLIEKTEYDSYAAFKAIDPVDAAKCRTFVNNLRANDDIWLTSARNMTKAYKNNRTSTNEASLNTALAVLSSAVSESLKYLAQIQSKTKTTFLMPHDVQMAFVKQLNRGAQNGH